MYHRMDEMSSWSRRKYAYRLSLQHCGQEIIYGLYPKYKNKNKIKGIDVCGIAKVNYARMTVQLTMMLKTDEEMVRQDSGAGTVQ